MGEIFCLIWKLTAKLEPALASWEKPLNAFVTRLQSASPRLWHYRAQQWPPTLSTTWVSQVFFPFIFFMRIKNLATNSKINRNITNLNLYWKIKRYGKKTKVDKGYTPQLIKALWMTWSNKNYINVKLLTCHCKDKNITFHYTFIAK